MEKTMTAEELFDKIIENIECLNCYDVHKKEALSLINQFKEEIAEEYFLLGFDEHAMRMANLKSRGNRKMMFFKDYLKSNP